MDRKIELSASLWERVLAAAQSRGFASPQQYVTDLIERDLSKAQGASSDAEIARKMEDLGYLDFGLDI